MKNLIILTIMAMFLGGCASFQEAYHLDREHGHNAQMAWDRQVAYPDYRHAGKTPEVLEGINAEHVMDGNNRTFGYEPKQEPMTINFGGK
ncbi:MAG: hypothetical protein GX751_05700 [Desulfuromonadaceae bacterium]|nr:hypothetical protein [Desulfuromonadaceae bacterium]